jgi:Sortase domain
MVAFLAAGASAAVFARPPATSSPVAPARAQAAAWIAAQVSGDTIVACDPAMCAALAAGPPDGRPLALPVELTVPAIGVSTRLVRLGLTPSGTLQVPGSFTVAGWYDRSPRPGATGPAIIAGHIDSVSGPAVFYRLDRLRPGDLAYVRRADGTVAAFRVTATALYPKDRFPTAAVYGSAPAPGAELRLITCGGVFDRAIHSYLSNVVVYAVAVRPRQAGS